MAVPRVRRLSGGVAIAISLLTAAVAGARVSLDTGQSGTVTLDGFLRSQSDIHTGNRNPNVGPDVGRFTLNQFRTWILTDTAWETPLPGLKTFARTRVLFDHTPDIESPRFNAFPTTGKNATLTRLSTDNAAGELWEGWLDYTRGNSWFRIGRQTIVWGDVAPTRLLDVINPLDLSFHAFSEPSGRDAFDNIRIPIWAARGSYALPFAPNFQVEGFVSPSDFGFIPTQLPAPDSPLDLVGLPPFIVLRDDTSDGEQGVSAGARLVGLVGPVNFTLNWINRNADDGIVQFENIHFDGSRCPNPSQPCGTNTNPPILSQAKFGALSGDRLHLVLKHPRFTSAGFSANYFEQVTNVVTRVEGVVDINRPFDLRTVGPNDFDGTPGTFQPNLPRRIRRLQLGYAVAFDRPSFIIRRDRTALITLQFEQRLRNKAGAGKQLGMLGAKTDLHNEVVTLLFSQPFPGLGGRYDEWFVDFVMLADPDDAFFLQPALRFEPGNNWRFAAWYNEFRGSEDRPGRFGSLSFAKGVNLSVSYQY